MATVKINESNPHFVFVFCSDGIISVDRRVYEHKLGTLSRCQTVSEVKELVKTSEKYLKDRTVSI